MDDCIFKDVISDKESLKVKERDQYSNDLMNVTITENDIQFEKMDKRGCFN